MHESSDGGGRRYFVCGDLLDILKKYEVYD